MKLIIKCHHHCERSSQSLQGQQLLRKQLFLIGILFVCCVWVLFQIDLQSSSKLLVIHPPDFKENITQGFLVNSKGCRIQDLDVFDQSIRKFIYDEKPLVCNKDKLSMLVKASGNTLYVDVSVLHLYNLTEDTVHCCYTPFWRRELSPVQIKNNSKKADKIIRYANYCLSFMSTTIEEQFVAVTCLLQNETYKDYFDFVLINETEEEMMKQDGLQEMLEKPSVLIVGVDSVSRLNLHRQMPKTVKFLDETVKAIEMLGYNKVGDNTFPNLIPVLTGLSVEELKDVCWKNTDTVFDECPFIWKNYKDNGYITGFGEDAARIGLFNYLKVGFRKQPTDFYLQAFNLAAEEEIGHEKWLNAPLCLGKRLNTEVLLDTVSQFAINLKKNPSFGFFWGTSLTHDYLNLAKYGDDYYQKFFETLYENGVFDTSIVIFMSDHGIRWGGIRTTYQGYLEERLPFLMIAHPKWFTDRFPNAVHNLRANRRKLTSPYDLYETLHDLVDTGNISNIMIRNRLKSTPTQNSKGQSLYLPISDSRTCNDSGIPNIWCTCHQSVKTSINDKNVKQSADSIVKYLNKMLKGYVQCSALRLNKIINARLEKVPLHKHETKVQQSSLTDYTVTIQTVPGKAVFEATVRYTKSSKLFNVIPPVSRINTYGNQSYCISHYILKLYCYCDSYWGAPS